MTDDDVALELLRSTKVVGLGVHKVTGDQVLDAHLELERLVSRESSTVRRVGNLRGWHVARWNNVTDWNTIAAALDHLLTIGEGFTFAEVDAIDRLVY